MPGIIPLVFFCLFLAHFYTLHKKRDFSWYVYSRLWNLNGNTLQLFYIPVHSPLMRYIKSVFRSQSNIYGGAFYENS